MKLNELELLDYDAATVVTKSLPIIFFEIGGNKYTWRGLGQKCPANARIVGFGHINFDKQGPHSVQFHYGATMFCATSKIILERRWHDDGLFGQHTLNIILDFAWFEEA